MNRVALPILFGLSLMGCEALETAVLLSGVVPGGSLGVAPGAPLTCMYAPAPQKRVLLSLDSAASYSFAVPIEVENKMSELMMPIKSDGAQVSETIFHGIFPLRYEVRWECDSNGFSSGMGPLVLPTFDLSRPFCLDNRADTDDNFVGMDFVPTDGALINAQATGIVAAQIVPFHLGAALADHWRIARLSDECCRNSPNCNGVSAAPACVELETIFRALDPRQTTLRVASASADTASPSLVQFRPFSIFDGNYMLRVSTENAVSHFSPRYPMRPRGKMQFVTTDGFNVTSNALLLDVRFCENCGFINPARAIPCPNDPRTGTPQPQCRDPQLDDACYYR